MKFRRHFELKKGIDLTPMIDVVFNLLIFFMLGATLIDTPSLKINLPESKTSESGQTSNSIIITISKDDNVYLGSSQMTINELSEELNILSQQQGELDKIIQIRADEDVLTKTLIDVIDRVKEAGFLKLNIATDNK